MEKRAFNVSIHKYASEMSDGINATRNANTKLAEGKKESGSVLINVGDDDGTDDSAPCRANANGTKFFRMLGIFVKSEEVHRIESVNGS